MKRRRLSVRVTTLAACLALTLAGCSSGDGTDRDIAAMPASSAPILLPPPGAAEAPAPEPTLLAPPQWTPGPGEIQPAVKGAANRFVVAAGTWEGSPGTGLLLAERLTESGLSADLVDAAQPLSDAEAVAATVEVIYPQYGGLTADRASIMVLLRQTLLSASGNKTARELTLDVRLALDEGSWRVDSVAFNEVGPAQAPSVFAQDVLENANISLPNAAATDIGMGRVDDAVLSMLTELARDHTLDVSVLSSGHPQNVFETDRQSNHTKGRAVDIWRIDGQLVVDPSTPSELLTAVMISAAEFGATEIGGPFDLNEERPGFFTDDVHKDHLHLGVTPGRPVPIR